MPKPSGRLPRDRARIPRATRLAAGVVLAIGVVGLSALVVPAPRAAEADEPRVCGRKDDPCPLQKWMRANMRAAMAANDLPGLARAFDAMASASPDPSWTWSAIAAGGASAARGGDLPRVKLACTTCHASYETPYRARFRLKPAP